MWASRNSTAPSRPALGRCHELSITPRFGSPSAAASSSVVQKSREAMGKVRSGGSERDAHAAVDFALLLDLGDRGAADLAGQRDMRPPRRAEGPNCRWR